MSIMKSVSWLFNFSYCNNMWYRTKESWNKPWSVYSEQRCFTAYICIACLAIFLKAFILDNNISRRRKSLMLLLQYYSIGHSLAFTVVKGTFDSCECYKTQSPFNNTWDKVKCFVVKQQMNLFLKSDPLVSHPLSVFLFVRKSTSPGWEEQFIGKLPS